MVNSTLNLFVYGTLMRGFRANPFIPRNAVMNRGKIVGNLYHYAAGYPIVQIPKDSSTIEGSLNYKIDLNVQEDRNKKIPSELNIIEGFNYVYGELYEIPYKEEILHAFDSYEGFTGRKDFGLYKRTLTLVQLENDSYKYAWVYNMNHLPQRTIHIPSGNWHDCFDSDGILKVEIFKELEKKANLW